MRALAGLAYWTVTVRDAERANRLTTLLFIKGDLFDPLATYFRERNFSIASEDLYARAVGLFVDYIMAKSDEFAERSDRGKLFNRFAHDLRHGTIRDGADPSQLWWLPRRIDSAAQLLAAVTAVTDWLVECHGTRSLNPWRTASPGEQMVFWRKWSIVASNSLLKHLKQPSHAAGNAAVARMHGLPERPLRLIGDQPPAFPDAEFDRLLFEGFVRPGKRGSRQPWLRNNVRDMMIALLLHAGGLRGSEPFHLWLSDVFVDPHDPELAHVRVYHPTDGEVETFSPASGMPIKMNRAAYLQLNHGLQPLNQTSRRAGWKGNLLQRNGIFMPVFWFPTYYGKLFLKLFRFYVEHVRPPSDLPWLFLTEAGVPMNGKTFSEMHRAAVLRVGMVPRKALGTTPHGHRHAYGRRIETARERKLLPEKAVQVCMHHRSPVSGAVYTQKFFSEINVLLQNASRTASLQSSIPSIWN